MRLPRAKIATRGAIIMLLLSHSSVTKAGSSEDCGPAAASALGEVVYELRTGEIKPETGQALADFEKRLEKDRLLLLIKKDDVFSGNPKDGRRFKPKAALPRDIKPIIKEIETWFERPADFSDWLIATKRKMGPKMLEKTAHFEAIGKTLEQNKLKRLMSNGTIDQGVYVQVLIEEAHRLGWRTPRKISMTKNGRKIYTPEEARALLAEGDLLWDMPVYASSHGRDPHILQLLYLADKIGGEKVRTILKWISRSGELGSDYWDYLFDQPDSSRTLHSPETINPFVKLVLPMR